MTDKQKAVDVFGNVAQCRHPEDGTLNVEHVITAAIASVLLLTEKARSAAKEQQPPAPLTLKQFLVKKVFSNSGPITNREICAIAGELFGERGDTYVAKFEAKQCLAMLGYTHDEMRAIKRALTELSYAEDDQREKGKPPEVLFPQIDVVCLAIGFKFAKHNKW